MAAENKPFLGIRVVGMVSWKKREVGKFLVGKFLFKLNSLAKLEIIEDFTLKLPLIFPTPIVAFQLH